MIHNQQKNNQTCRKLSTPETCEIDDDYIQTGNEINEKFTWPREICNSQSRTQIPYNAWILSYNTDKNVKFRSLHPVWKISPLVWCNFTSSMAEFSHLEWQSFTLMTALCKVSHWYDDHTMQSTNQAWEKEKQLWFTLSSKWSKYWILQNKALLTELLRTL